MALRKKPHGNQQTPGQPYSDVCKALVVTKLQTNLPMNSNINKLLIPACGYYIMTEFSNKCKSLSGVLHIPGSGADSQRFPSKYVFLSLSVFTDPKAVTMRVLYRLKYEKSKKVL